MRSMASGFLYYELHGFVLNKLLHLFEPNLFFSILRFLELMRQPNINFLYEKGMKFRFTPNGSYFKVILNL